MSVGERISINYKIVLEKTINKKDSQVPQSPLYSIFRRELLVLQKTLIELLNKNFIRASNSLAAASILFAKKSSGELRFYVDYRELNALTLKDRYLILLIKNTLNSLSKAKQFTKLNVVAAFYKIRIVEGKEQKTAFRIRYSLFEQLVTFFSLTKVSAIF